MPFKPGQSGNPKGRSKRPVEEAYLKAVVKSMPKARWSKVLDRVGLLAERGERWAVEFYADRIMGKPVQPVNTDHSGEITFNVNYADELSDNPTETP